MKDRLKKALEEALALVGIIGLMALGIVYWKYLFIGLLLCACYVNGTLQNIWKELMKHFKKKEES